jgi:hypothetical protein
MLIPESGRNNWAIFSRAVGPPAGFAIQTLGGEPEGQQVCLNSPQHHFRIEFCAAGGLNSVVPLII